MVVSLQELRERRGKLEAKFKAIVDDVERSDRDLTDAEEATLLKIRDDDLALKARIEAAEHLSRWSHELDQPANPYLHNRISGGSMVTSNLLDLFGDGQVARELDAAVAAFTFNSHGRSVPSEIWDASERGGYHPTANGLEIELSKTRPVVGGNWNMFGTRNSIGTVDPGKGGTLVRHGGFSGQLEHALKLHAPVIHYGEVITTDSGESMPWPTCNDTSSEGFLVGEHEESGEQDMSFGAVVFGSNKLSSGVVRVSEELLTDSPLDVAGEVGAALGTRLGRGMNRLLTIGQSANGPRGIVPRATVGKETASSTAIAGDEVLDLVASVDPAYQALPTTGFMMSPLVFSYLAKLKDLQGRYLLGDLQNGVTPKLRGWDVVLNPNMSSSLTAGEKVILFGDLSRYKVRIVRGIRLRTLSEKYASRDETGFLGFLRFDGDLLDAGTHPIKALQMKP